jgi:multicomponent Na+:H+ antiporter subunit F
MRLLRWIFGLVIVAGFLYYDFFVFEGTLLVRLINVSLFCALFVLFRVIFGPSPADRIVAVDILGILIVGMLAIMGIYYDQNFFMDIALIWALLSFIASLAFAKILEGRQLDE